MKNQWRFLYTLLAGMLAAMILLPDSSFAEGTKELEPQDAPSNSYCRITLAIDEISDRVPFALVDCSESYRLNIRINDYLNEKIYLGFGNVRGYGIAGEIVNDMDFQLKDPNGNVVPGFALAQIPGTPGSNGFIRTLGEALNGPNINNTNPAGYKPLVVSPAMNGDYVLEFGFQDGYEGIMRTFEYFDVSVVNGNTVVPGRLWSKAWQLSSGGVISGESASYSTFYIYSTDSIVTSFQSNGLAGGIWVIYSNEWGCSTTGNWSERRQSVAGNATVPPQYQIFLNDPDPVAFPTGVIGEMISATALPHVCDTVINFAATVSKGGNIEILIDVPPLNPGDFGPEDVQLGYGVFPGYNVLQPGWDGKNAFGVAVPNGTQVEARINFLNGLTNIPLHDVEDNPHGFKVDILRPAPATGNTKLKIFWDDTSLPTQSNPTSNVIDGCIYPDAGFVSGCHDWDFATSELGNLNTVNSWWYYSSEDQLTINIVLELLPRKGNISGPFNICAGQSATFRTTSIPSAPKYVWNLSGPGFSFDFEQDAPDTTFTYQFLPAMSTGQYTVSVYGLNPECGAGESGYMETVLFDEDPPLIAGSPSACLGIETQYQIAGLYSSIEWSSGRGEILGSPVNNQVTIRWSSPGADTIRVYSTTSECGTRLSVLPVLINPVAEASFIAEVDATSCPGLPLLFTETSTITSGDVVKRKWTWDDGLSDSTAFAQITHSYADTGFYHVKLVVTTNLGCHSEVVNSVKIIPYPEASFKTFSNCVAQGIELTDISTGINLANWEWDFGNAPVTAGNLNQQQPSAVFHLPGLYTVTMIVTNQYGCKDTVVQEVEIHNPPIAAYNFDFPCQSRGIVFSDQSVEADTSLVHYNWLAKSPYGDVSFQGNPVTIIFDNAGEYTVVHTVTDAFGCIANVDSTFSVISKPAGDFNYVRIDTDPQGVLRFKNLTTGAVGYSWDFGNNTTSSLFEPVAMYADEKNYSIVLVSVSTEGCTDTTVRAYYYYPELYLPNAFTPDYDGLNDVFKPVTGRTTLEPYLLRIYNAWGQLIFSSTDPDRGWDGKHMGEACPTGVYIYTLDYREGVDGSTKVVSKKGTVTLINR